MTTGFHMKHIEPPFYWILINLHIYSSFPVREPSSQYRHLKLIESQNEVPLNLSLCFYFVAAPE